MWIIVIRTLTVNNHNYLVTFQDFGVTTTAAVQLCMWLSQLVDQQQRHQAAKQYTTAYYPHGYIDTQYSTALALDVVGLYAVCDAYQN